MQIGFETGLTHFRMQEIGLPTGRKYKVEIIAKIILPIFYNLKLCSHIVAYTEMEGGDI